VPWKTGNLIGNTKDAISGSTLSIDCKAWSFPVKNKEGIRIVEMTGRNCEIRKFEKIVKFSQADVV